MVGWESTSTCETQCIQVTLNVVTAEHNNTDRYTALQLGLS